MFRACCLMYTDGHSPDKQCAGPGSMERCRAGSTSSNHWITHLGLFILLLVGQSSPGRAELPPEEPQKPQDQEMQPDANFLDKASILNSFEPEYIKCFTEHLEDLTCFWEGDAEVTMGENRPHRFYYQLDRKQPKACSFTAQRTARMTTLYVCLFPMDDVALFDTLNLWIVAGDGNTTLHSRSLQVEAVVLLDPPFNVTVVQEKDWSKHLVIQWLPPNSGNIDDMLMYEVNISSPDSDVQKVEVIKEKTELVLTSVKGETTYTIAVRAKPDGISYNGYWSAWSKPVTMATSNDLDPLVMVLACTLVLSVLIVSASLFLAHRRFLKKKIWPAIPDPSNHFEGLFTTHKGNFQQWLGHSSSYVWWRPHHYNMEGLVASLEVLSELSPAHPGFLQPLDYAQATEDIPIFVPQLQSSSAGQGAGPPQLPPLSMDSYVILGENFMPCGVAPNSTLEGPAPQASLARQESVGTAHTKSSNSEEGADGERDSGLSSSCNSGSPGAGAEEQTSSSSFEYAIFDPTRLALSSRPRAPQTDLKYPYLLVSDSGVSTDYSGMNDGPGLYRNLYENDIRLGPFSHNQVIYSQC